MRMGIWRCMWRLPAEPFQKHSRWEIRVPPTRVGFHLSWGEESDHGAAGEDAQAATLCRRCAATPLAEQQPHCWAQDELQDPEEQLVSGAFAVCRVSRSSEQGGAPAHVRQPGAVGADQQPLRPLSTIRVSPHATPQVCPQLPVTPTEQNQLCRLQGLIHPGVWPSIFILSTFLTAFVQDLIGPVPIASPSCWILRVAAKGLHHLYTSLLLCQRPSGAHLAANYTSGGSGYITTCETELWLCYIRAPLSILWKCKTTFISGVDLYDYDMRCHSAIENENYIFIFWRKTICKGRECVLFCCLNHPAINTWSLEQKSTRRNVRRKSNCTVQNGI